MMPPALETAVRDAVCDCQGIDWDKIEAAAEAAIESRAAALVAERLRTAPEVEAAIADANMAWWDEALRRCSPGGRAVILETDDRIATNRALSAAIARAIADARRDGFAAGSAERTPIHDALGVSTREATLAAMAHGVPCPTCGTEAPPDAENDHLVERALANLTTVAYANGMATRDRATYDPEIAASKRLAAEQEAYAAIAADKARAVEAARVGWVEAVSEERAEELVDEFARHVYSSMPSGDFPDAEAAADAADHDSKATAARTALLAALTGQEEVADGR